MVISENIDLIHLFQFHRVFVKIETSQLNGLGFSSSLQMSCSMERGEVVGL